MKYVFITGGSRGLGRMLCEAFAKEQYGIFLNYVQNEEAALQAKQELESQYSVPVFLMKGDVSDPCQVKTMFDTVQGITKQIDVLILNAGIDHVCEIPEKSYESFMRVLSVNLVGNFLMTQTFGMAMEEQKYGTIIYINSDNAIDQNDPVTLEYDVSKAGLLMLAKDYAQYFQYVKVHTVAPGWMDTQMNVIPEDIKKEISFVDLETVCQTVLETLISKETGNVVVVRK